MVPVRWVGAQPCPWCRTWGSGRCLLWIPSRGPPWICRLPSELSLRTRVAFPSFRSVLCREHPLEGGSGGSQVSMGVWLVCCEMAKQKRKESKVAEKKSKKLKKVSAVEMPVARMAPPGTGTAPAEGPACPSPSPEEQRALDRKLKKERKKEARRRLQRVGVAAAPRPATERSGAALALEYLCSRREETWRRRPHPGRPPWQDPLRTPWPSSGRGRRCLPSGT
ncbi:uncharacterized protein C7orf50 homolog isoform X2 [Moschus berezovskii]|uniref:uncharacterized protein C7orf50 homolog isoform X2 n=1 Tax=Moschus berezovskii TaxID=68408 RepID=UPI0024439B41|nr:uncharacterized protein C7orf50 homolog isoform X2 [Moschus berezovskii]